MLWTRFFPKIKKGSEPINTDGRVMILAFCSSSGGPLSMYQVSFNSLVYFQRYTPDKLSIAKIKNGRNSVNTVDGVMVLALCHSPRGPFSVYQVSLNYVSSVLLEKCSGQKCDGWMDRPTDGRSDGQSGNCMLYLRGA